MARLLMICGNVGWPDSECAGRMRVHDTIAGVWIHLPVCGAQRASVCVYANAARARLPAHDDAAGTGEHGSYAPTSTSASCYSHCKSIEIKW